MSDLSEIIRLILLAPPATSEDEAIKLLKGIPGRGTSGYNSKLKSWLESNPDAFPEQIGVIELDSPYDHGVDVKLEGVTTRKRIGFQIKSDNDLEDKDFIRKCKSQITDAKSWKLSLQVIILACQPNKGNKLKCEYLLSETGRWNDEGILVLDPTKAAGLLKAFDHPLKKPDIPTKTWQQFFIDLGKEYLITHYIDRWPNFPPDARFINPSNFDEIFKSSREKPLTIVIGPPAVGKTFAILQLLWRSFQEGKNVKWITPESLLPTEGPIPDPYGNLDFKQRVDVLSRTLGIEPCCPPLDSTEFIDKNIRPNTVIYIEDPFGKRDKEFVHSLHTYSFFDLNKFVNTIKENSDRASCRIIISSREGLFEQWLKELEKENIPKPDFELIRIRKDSYNVDNMNNFIQKLVKSKNFKKPESFAEEILQYTETPFDTEMIIQSLPDNATVKEAIEIGKKHKKKLKEEAMKYVIVENDLDLLFLLLLVSLRTGGMGRNYFDKWYHYCPVKS